MNISVTWVLVLCLVATTAAQGKSYTPIGSYEATQRRGAFLPVTIEDRPVLPSIRPVEVELLEDALRRKANLKIGTSREEAHKKIIRDSTTNSRERAQIKGALAEAMYLEKNPEWGYVRKQNDPHDDVYVFRKGMQPLSAQIKTHTLGSPATYARDMLKDHKADLFLVPDDHVDSLREHWRAQMAKHKGAGRTADAIEARRQLSRVGGLGFTTEQLDDRYSCADRYTKREQYAGYVSLGAAAGLVMGTELWNYVQTGYLTEQAVLRGVHGGSVLATERAVTHVMTRNARAITSTSPAHPSGIDSALLRGSWRGNAVIGTSILAVDTTFAVYEHGGRQAFRNDAFYTGLGGSVSALTVGLTVGQTTTAWMVNPSFGFIAGAASATAAYLAGQKLIDAILRPLNAKNLRKKDEVIYAATRAYFKKRIEDIQKSVSWQFPAGRRSLTKGALNGLNDGLPETRLGQ